jgi:hypothetical protein
MVLETALEGHGCGLSFNGAVEEQKLRRDGLIRLQNNGMTVRKRLICAALGGF